MCVRIGAVKYSQRVMSQAYPDEWEQVVGVAQVRGGRTVRQTSLSGCGGPAPRRVGVGRKDVPPTGDIWTLAQQLATFTLGHTAPDTPLDAIVKGLGKAAGTYRTIRADPARASLLLAVGEQRVCHSATVRKKGPVISLVACHDSYSTLTWQTRTSIVCQKIKDDLYRCLAVQVSGIVSPVTYSGCHAVHAPQARLVEPFQGED